MTKLMELKTYTRAASAAANILCPITLFRGDCFKLIASLPDDSVDLTFTSPPYCMGKEYESSRSVEDFVSFHRRLLPEVVRVTKPGGSICWQIGYHSRKGQVVPLDYFVYGILTTDENVFFRNRIIWSFAHGLHRTQSFSGRHETILWFTKGRNYKFDLDSIRVPQKYPGKKYYKGPKKGKYSGNPLGKNPGDVWEDIPNVKGHHVEKLDHPCQFPVALPQRLIRSVCSPGGLVFDPFMGVGSTGVAAILERRRFLGAEVRKDYTSAASARLRAAQAGTAKVRPLDQPIFEPIEGQAVSTRPSHFRA